MKGTKSRILSIGMIAYSALLISWVAAPIYRKFMGICPVRPGAVDL